MHYGRPVRNLRGMGWPILPDSFNAAAGGFESFSPNTPDATIVQMLTSQGQQLPPDLAARWAAQSGQQSSGAAGSASSSGSAAVSASGQPLSTQTGAGVSVANVSAITPTVYLWTMTDGSKHYADLNGNPVSYTPPPPTPVVTPAAGSQPIETVVTALPAITGNPASGTSGGLMTVGTPVPAVTASGQPISSTSGAPVQTVAPAASSDIMLGTFDLSAFLTGSIITGVPNWLLIAGGAAAFFMFSGGGGSTSRRR